MGVLNRRHFLGMLGTGAAIGGSVLGKDEPKKTKGIQWQGRKKRPNVIFIIADDMSRGMFGYLGGKTLTPNIDRLANEGVNFTRAYVNTSVCTPSRYSCLTGQYASRCQDGYFKQDITFEGQTRVLWNPHVTPEFNNLPMTLQKGGYKTGLVGKWHVGWFGSQRDWVPPGSDPADPKVDAVLKKNYKSICEHIKTRGFDFVKSATSDNLNDSPMLRNCGCNVHNMEWMTKSALEFIDASKDEPFFLYFSPTLMHVPDVLKSLKADPRICAEGLLDKPIAGVQPSRESIFKRVKEAGFSEKSAAVTWLDDGIGALMKKLEELKIAEDTLILFYNDNGMDDGGKGTCYEGGIRTEIMAYWPGMIEHRKCSEFVQNIDFAPTILDLAKIKKPKDLHLDGRSLVPLFKEEKVKWRDSVYTEVGYTRAVTTKKWKYLAFRVPASKQGTLESRMKEQMEAIRKRGGEGVWKVDPEARYYHLGMVPGGIGFERGTVSGNPPYMPNYFDSDQLYDLENDPKESKNLAKDPVYKDQLEKMKAIMKLYLNDLPGTFSDLKPNI